MDVIAASTNKPSIIPQIGPGPQSYFLYTISVIHHTFHIATKLFKHLILIGTSTATVLEMSLIMPQNQPVSLKQEAACKK